ncbi:uncharacterized protein PHALS_15441 [Plasmopara halstedii]|uniref:Uncharacterized protein n=1 Tax=Plasmopara halstedii TaxID=4781 RepID=A0A0P1ATT2_PLAHL|nr:uncharacterized protein PHALS_15441 [Plasmopara halstedii]CEG44729.1 hypothetical protein PHALS_15441 [Plasmopara halstedii]|eukprot:XP_024581098.1 hypothetical protein PHALS_15441 [Plasmopara halstedii]
MVSEGRCKSFPSKVCNEADAFNVDVASSTNKDFKAHANFMLKTCMSLVGDLIEYFWVVTVSLASFREYYIRRKVHLYLLIGDKMHYLKEQQN